MRQRLHDALGPSTTAVVASRIIVASQVFTSVCCSRRQSSLLRCEATHRLSPNMLVRILPTTIVDIARVGRSSRFGRIP